MGPPALTPPACGLKKKPGQGPLSCSICSLTPAWGEALAHAQLPAVGQSDSYQIVGMNYTSVGWFNFLCRFPLVSSKMKIGPSLTFGSMCKEERAVTIGMEVDTVWIYECASRGGPWSAQESQGEYGHFPRLRGAHTMGPCAGNGREAWVSEMEGPKGGSGQCCGLTVSSLLGTCTPPWLEEGRVIEDLRKTPEGRRQRGEDDIRELGAKKLALIGRRRAKAAREDPGGARPGTRFWGGWPAAGPRGGGGGVSRTLSLGPDWFHHLCSSSAAQFWFGACSPLLLGSKAGSGSSSRIC